MADECYTLIKAAYILISRRAKDAVVIIPHSILSGDMLEALNSSKLKSIFVTKTVPCVLSS